MDLASGCSRACSHQMLGNLEMVMDKRISFFIVAMLGMLPLSAFGEAGARMEIIVLGAVWHQGAQRVSTDATLEEVLNRAVCHKGSSLKKVRISRKTGQGLEELVVGLQDRKDPDQKPAACKLVEGDIITVPERLFSPDDSKTPVVVKGPFVLQRNIPVKD